MPMKHDNGLMLAVDFGAIFWRAWKARDKGSPEAKALDAVNGLCAVFQPDSVVIGLDSEVSIRKQRFPSYKSRRPPKPEGYEEAKAAVLGALKEHYVTACREGWEADDILAYYVKHAWRENEVVIATHDKDMFQLVDDRVSVFSTYHAQRFSDADVYERYHVYPWQFVDYLAIVGDQADSINGIRGWGPVRATKLLNDHHSIERALAVGAIHKEYEAGLRVSQWLVRLMPSLEEAGQDFEVLASV